MNFNYLFSDANKANVSYFLLIQDIVGILIVLLGLKLSILYFLCIIRQGKKSKNIICLMGSVMLILSGINLVFFYEGLRTWTISIVLVIIGFLLGKLAYKKLY
ncbi:MULTISPECIES: hypothetical protein [unclassified Sedimentibacter]|uniref:hypothetical protein n=1 Tax=unclassified Sedimentibacter TaxID=2649220 RepID=UPI0027DF1269|nr:hypothetical protein [Sedimentibacter sp. MB35-C1]WMJ77739.1 hypothetical protein RBQ61_02080 [Sedimentibacter sp. MB35-C1]